MQLSVSGYYMISTYNRQVQYSTPPNYIVSLKLFVLAMQRATDDMICSLSEFFIFYTNSFIFLECRYVSTDDDAELLSINI